MFNKRQSVGASLTGVLLAALTVLAFAPVSDHALVAHGQQQQTPPAPAASPTAGPGSACVGTQAYVAIPALGITTALTSAIPLLSVDTAALNSTTIGSGGGDAGKTTFNPLTFVMRPNPHTVDLFATLAGGQHIDEVDVLFVGASGGKQTVCRTVTLQTVIVTRLEVQMGQNLFGLFGSGDAGTAQAGPTSSVPFGASDAVTLVYGSVSIADGGKSAGWSVITNGPTP